MAHPSQGITAHIYGAPGGDGMTTDQDRAEAWAALDAEYADALAFPCSTCQAPAASPCTMRPRGMAYRAPFHASRVDKQMRALDKVRRAEARK